MNEFYTNGKVVGQNDKFSARSIEAGKRTLVKIDYDATKDQDLRAKISATALAMVEVQRQVIKECPAGATSLVLNISDLDVLITLMDEPKDFQEKMALGAAMGQLVLLMRYWKEIFIYDEDQSTASALAPQLRRLAGMFQGKFRMKNNLGEVIEEAQREGEKK